VELHERIVFHIGQERHEEQEVGNDSYAGILFFGLFRLCLLRRGWCGGNILVHLFHSMVII
jgi:hypothetical protein